MQIKTSIRYVKLRYNVYVSKTHRNVQQRGKMTCIHGSTGRLVNGTIALTSRGRTYLYDQQGFPCSRF